MTNQFALEGLSALVTGRGSGIGREAALAFAAAGATVAVGEPASVAAAVAAAARAGEGRLDVLLNNAGINVVKSTDAVTLEDWERVIRVDLTGVFLCRQAAARVMRRHGGGRIINMASIYGLVGPVLHAPALTPPPRAG